MQPKIHFATKENFENYKKTGGMSFYEWDFIETLSKAAYLKNKSILMDLNDTAFFIPLLERRALKAYPIAFSLPFGLYGGFFPFESKPFQRMNKIILSPLRKFIQSDIVMQNAFAQEQLHTTALTPIARTFTQVIKFNGETRDDIFNKIFTSQTRQKIRKAQKSNLEIISGNNEKLMNHFFELYMLSNRRWGKKTPKYSRDFFNEFLNKSYIEITVAYREKIPISAVIILKLLRHHQYWFGAMDKRFGQYCSNYLLFFYAICKALDAKVDFFDFGPSGTIGKLFNVVRFKESFGSTRLPYEIFFYGNTCSRTLLSVAMHLS